MSNKEAIKNLAKQVLRLVDIVDKKSDNDDYWALYEIKNATVNLISELTQEDYLTEKEE